MLMKSPAMFLMVLVFIAFVGIPARSQEQVTIPKSRLEELERKEKQLEELRHKGTAEQKPTQIPGPPVSAASNGPVVQPQPTPLTQLPPFTDGDTVEARDLASYYLQAPAAADQRFKKHKIQVRGEIAGFDKPMLRRNYKILLKTADRDSTIVCDFFPANNVNAVFTANHGSQLVALHGETRVPLAKVGQTVLIQGLCKGRSDNEVIISASSMKPEQ